MIVMKRSIVKHWKIDKGKVVVLDPTAHRGINFSPMKSGFFGDVER